MMETKIIKSSLAKEQEAVAAPNKIIKKELFQASEEAREIIEAARQEAERIVARAEHDRTASVESGLQIGYEEGLKRWNQTLAELWKSRDDLKIQWEQSLLQLAIRVAEKIVGEQLRLHPDTIVTIVREALKSVGQERLLTLQVHPDHREAVQRIWTGFNRWWVPHARSTWLRIRMLPRVAALSRASWESSTRNWRRS